MGPYGEWGLRHAISAGAWVLEGAASCEVCMLLAVGSRAARALRAALSPPGGGSWALVAAGSASGHRVLELLLFCQRECRS